MKGDDFIVSGFDGEAGETALFAVDFASAKRLDAGGSTCDVYECIVQRRRVFVKRLKAEYRDNPLYRSAFNKEYDLGVELSHPSLPRYVGFGGDYIVMDFIEGDTLADLIKRGDKRLKNKKFVIKLLGELIDAVDYLHYRNIVHCDIKADNIIISPYADRPSTLIDFDKAYSSWLDSTYGNAAKYGCDNCADGTIDFRGIGLIADKLGVKRVAEACRKESVSADYIRKLLRDNKYRWWMILSGIFFVACAVAILLSGNSNQTKETETAVPVLPATADSIHAPIPGQSLSSDKPAISVAWIESLITNKSTEIEGYRQSLWRTLDSDTISIADKRTAIMDYTYQSGMATIQIISSAAEKYSNLPELEVQMAVRNHPAWIRLTKEDEATDSRIREWNAKVSQRSSTHPVSQPDTLPSDSLPVPHH